MRNRILVSIALFISVLLLPFWIYMPAIILSIVLFPLYVESILLALLVYTLYSAEPSIQTAILSPFVLVTVLSVIMFMFLRDRLRFGF